MLQKNGWELRHVSTKLANLHNLIPFGSQLMTYQNMYAHSPIEGPRCNYTTLIQAFCIVSRFPSLPAHEIDRFSFAMCLYPNMPNMDDYGKQYDALRMIPIGTFPHSTLQRDPTGGGFSKTQIPKRSLIDIP